MNGTISKKTELSSQGKKPSTYRRIVTGNVGGGSVAQSDEHMQAYQFKTVPGYEHTLIWLNKATPDLKRSPRRFWSPSISTKSLSTSPLSLHEVHMLEFTAFSIRDPKKAAEMFAEDGAFKRPYLATF